MATSIEGEKIFEEKEEFKWNFPVVGIGASAGVLETIQHFFQYLPANPNVAFIIIQHLSPDYKSLMDELLSRYTKMEIHRVEDGMQVEKNMVYLIPPSKNMTVYKGKLYLTGQKPEKRLNLPVDIFLQSLAQDAGKQAGQILEANFDETGQLKFNDEEWNITNLDGMKIPGSKLPSSIVMKTKKNLYNYTHYI